VTETADWPLSPGAARTFYNAADAWLGAEAAAFDPVAELGPLPGAARLRLERALLWLEWSPRLLLRSRSGLSWLPRAERRAWLDRLERSGPFRRAVAIVRTTVEDTAALAQEEAEESAAAARAQSRDGA
jgi:hypothetical protein